MGASGLVVVRSNFRESRFSGVGRILVPFGPTNRKRARLAPVPFGYLPVVVVSECAVIPTGQHAASLESYVQSRTGRDRCCLPCHDLPQMAGRTHPAAIPQAQT